VCRTQYAYLPAICAKLHHFIRVQFQEQYAARRDETEGARAVLPVSTKATMCAALLPACNAFILAAVRAAA
jgi:hypothetical protein